ncbi:MAG: serine hydrolase [Clostridia bacterium]|nr:serine hydrolase [Clostridia bacterium]
MDFPAFIAACEADPAINLTHFLCTDAEGVLARYVDHPYRMDSLKLMFSMTKSISALAIGIAWDRGLLRLDDRVAELLGECAPSNRSEHLDRMEVRHLLTMSSGIHENTYAALYPQPDWVRAFLAQDFAHEPGTFYRYSTHGSHMLSALITQASGQSLEEFMNEHLFFPMGIFEAQWETSPEGLTAGGMGLSLRPESLAKVARLLLNRGVFQDRRLISESYIDQATSLQIVKQDEWEKQNSLSGTGYGFQFHVGRAGDYRMDGAFGQVCLISPRRGLAFVAFSRRTKVERLLEQIERFFPEGDREISGDVRRRPPQLRAPAERRAIPQGRFALEANPLRVRELMMEPGAVRMRFDEGAVSEIRFAVGAETRGTAPFIKDLQVREQSYVCAAEWDGEWLHLCVHYIETPYVVEYRFCVDEGQVTFAFSINVSFTLSDFIVRGKECTGEGWAP